MKVVETLHDVAPDEWNALAGGNVMARHDWLVAVEEAGAGGLAPRYILRQEGDRLVGAAVSYLASREGSGLSPDHLLLRRLQPIASRLGLSFLPALVCAPYRAYGAHILGRDPGPLLDKLEILARSLGLPLHFPRVLDEETQLRRLLIARGYHRTVQDPIACLDIEWNSFEGYLDSLKRVSRKVPPMVRYEIKRNRQAGIAIREITDAAAFASRLHHLAQAHHLRLNRGGPPLPYGPEFLPRMKAMLNDRCALYGAFKDGELIGFSTMLRDGDTGFVPFLGLVDESERGDFTYFNVVFYRPIADAIAVGLRRLFYGTFQYDTKVRRGCRILPTGFYYRGATPARHLALAPWFQAHDWWASRFKFAGVHALGRPRLEA